VSEEEHSMSFNISIPVEKKRREKLINHTTTKITFYTLLEFLKQIQNVLLQPTETFSPEPFVTEQYTRFITKQLVKQPLTVSKSFDEISTFIEHLHNNGITLSSEKYMGFEAALHKYIFNMLKSAKYHLSIFPICRKMEVYFPDTFRSTTYTHTLHNFLRRQNQSIVYSILSK